jgi:hypothetical protein
MTIDKRTKAGKQFLYWKNILSQKWFWAMELIAVIIAILLMVSIWKGINPKPKMSDIKVQKIEAYETPFCFDAITCIRDIGEELGMSNKDIMIAIRISKAECGMRVDAIGKNSNGTFDIGVMQINDVHNKRISRADRLDMQKNIRFAYKLRLEQGHWNAWSVCKNGKVDCR